MQGIASRQKRYVEVVTRTGTDGKIMPLSIIWEDGRSFDVDQVIDMRRAASLKVGGSGIRYICEIKGTRTFLYFEDPLWFVEEKLAQEESLVIGE
ncbi:MAG: hypothetical protein FWF91_06315 [Coriobacteriia bacterium]|nr:hypothetical protein [Coriobacteriia bacterium]